MTSTLPPSQGPLAERYERESGKVFLSGIQALVRMLIDQRRQDARAGLKTGMFISGYPGSPLSGLDTALRQAQPFLDAHGIRHQPAQNEEFAAASLMGTQMIDEHPHPDVDGVVALWYGKGPGVDRSSDAIKHGNFAGTSRLGAVVILSGEDHEAKSSSVPYQQDFSFEHLGVPVLYPADVGEFLEFGRHAVGLSRYSGCWVALKLIGGLCDGGQTIDLDAVPAPIVEPALEIDGKPFQKRANFRFYPGVNLETERQLYHERHTAARAYARANRLDRITVSASGDRTGIVAAGKTYTDTRQALRDLGFTDAAALSAAGIRLLKIGMTSPLDDDIVRQFAQGLDDIIVVEEKRDFIERQVAAAVTKIAQPPRVVGKTDEKGRAMFPIPGGFDNDLIATVLARRLAESHRPLPPTAERRLGELNAIRGRNRAPWPRRTPNFCSGCPHATSTRLAPGQIAWAAPGCHIMAMLIKEPEKTVSAVTQFAGEGMPWVGLSPYTSRPHLVQNIGDGSLFHSSYLNIRYAVATGVNITYKILYNGAIANTGGQPSVGAKSIPDLVKLLALEGVKKIVVASREPSRYRGLPGTAEARDIADLVPTLEELEKIKGTTVLIYDGSCANERRRRQKRGRIPPTTNFTVVNEDLCENCGQCADLANCMSLHKVDTPLGPKTRIHQSSCNQDQACVQAECPSFLTVTTRPGGGPRKPDAPKIDDAFPTPTIPKIDRPYQVYVPGVGGTGVLTVNAILAQAATFDGHKVLSYDQTGASQKWGAVLSSLILVPPGVAHDGNKVAQGRADLYLALDLVAGADAVNLDRCTPGRTVAVINSSILPTAEMARDVRFVIPGPEMVAAIDVLTAPDKNLTLDARAIAETLLGDYMMTNMVAVGAACQAGLLPITPASIEAAIRFNGVGVEANLQAFRAGRLSQCAPERLAEILPKAPATLADRFAEFERVPKAARCQARDRLLAKIDGLDDATRAAFGPRIEDLIDYQNEALAGRYVAVVAQAWERERALGGDGALTRAVIANLHKLMAYKDEYEVARLLTQGLFRQRLAAAFDDSARFFVQLRPPFLRRFGLKRKVALGGWAWPMLGILKGLRGLRGTGLDPFGGTAIRRAERRLIDWYVQTLSAALAALTPANRAAVQAIAQLPDDIRGYDEIKLASAKAVQERADALLRELRP